MCRLAFVCMTCHIYYYSIFSVQIFHRKPTKFIIVHVVVMDAVIEPYFCRTSSILLIVKYNSVQQLGKASCCFSHSSCHSVILVVPRVIIFAVTQVDLCILMGRLLAVLVGHHLTFYYWPSFYFFWLSSHCFCQPFSCCFRIFFLLF